MDKKQQTVNTYNEAAGKMTQKFNDMGARVSDIEKALAYISKPNPNVLEIGCGNGRDAKEIVKRTNNYLGMDISEGMIKIAHEYVPQGDFKISDVESFEFPQNLDAIFSFASLLHSAKENVKIVLDKAYQSLNESGVFFISLKYGDYHDENITDEFGTRTFYFYNPEIIKELAGEKFKVVYENTHDLRNQRWFEIILQK